MLPIKHILFPIDFSERCLATAPHVASMARRFGAKITLLNVLQPFWYAPMAEAPVIVDLEEIRRGLERELSLSFKREFDGLTTERFTLIGDPARLISDFAEKSAVDLIMMPTHGYGPFRKFLLGSVTSKVLHDCNRPIWTNAHVQDLPAHCDLKTVLCAVDVEPKSADLLKAAALFSERVGAKLRLVHVTPTPPDWPDFQVEPDLEARICDEARQSIGELQKSLSITAPLCLVQGDVARSVRDVAEQHGADLVMIGRGVMHERLGRLRTNAHAIIRESACPVLSI